MIKTNKRIEELLHKEGLVIEWINRMISSAALVRSDDEWIKIYPYFGENWLGSMNISKNHSLFELYSLMHKIQEKEMGDIIKNYMKSYDLFKYEGDISYCVSNYRVHLLYQEYSIFSLPLQEELINPEFDEFEFRDSDLKIGEFVYSLLDEVKDNPILITETCFKFKIKESLLKESLMNFQRYVCCVNETFLCEDSSKWIESQFEKNKDKKIIVN